MMKTNLSYVCVIHLPKKVKFFFVILTLPFSTGLSTVCTCVCFVCFAGGPSDPGGPLCLPSTLLSLKHASAGLLFK